MTDLNETALDSPLPPVTPAPAAVAPSDQASASSSSSSSSQSTLEPRAPRRRAGVVFFNFLTLTVSSVGSRIVQLVVSVYARRALGAVAIGQVEWTTSVISYFALLINPGLETIAKREVSRDASHANRYVSLLLSLQTVLAGSSFLLVLVVALSAWLGFGQKIVGLLLLIQCLTLVAAPITFGWLLHAHERMARLALAELAAQVLQLPLLFLLVHSPNDVLRFAAFPVTVRLFVTVYTILVVWRMRFADFRELRFDFTGWRGLVREAIPLGLSQATILIYYNSDSILLRFLPGGWGDEAVGLYGTAYKLMLVPTFICASLLSAYFPQLSRAASDDAASKRISAEFLDVLAVLGVPIALGGWATGRYLVHLLYGSKFDAAGPLFEWLSLDLLLIFVNVGLTQPFNAWGLQKDLFRMTLVGAVVNVALNLPLIPFIGPWGAVISTIAAEVAVFAMAVAARRRIFPIAWFGRFLPYLLIHFALAVALKLSLARVERGRWWLLCGGAAVIAATAMVYRKDLTARLAKRLLPKRAGN